MTRDDDDDDDDDVRPGVTSTVNALARARLLHIYYNIVRKSRSVGRSRVTLKANKAYDANQQSMRSSSRPSLIAKHVPPGLD